MQCLNRCSFLCPISNGLYESTVFATEINHRMHPQLSELMRECVRLWVWMFTHSFACLISICCSVDLHTHSESMHIFTGFFSPFLFIVCMGVIVIFFWVIRANVLGSLSFLSVFYARMNLAPSTKWMHTGVKPKREHESNMFTKPTQKIESKWTRWRAPQHKKVNDA